MSLIDLILAAEAAETGVAVRRTAYRHQHLAEKPLVMVAYNLSGEAAAPLGIMYGTDADPTQAKLAVAAEPRNRESRFGAINAFAKDFADFVAPYLALKTEPKRGGGFRQVASSAPQLVVPNRSTRAYLGARLGRSLRYLGLGDLHEVPEETKWAGSHLSWFAEHAMLPGQSTFLAMTESLSQHFATGQSALEDESLATLLAWIDGITDHVLPTLEGLEDQAFGPVPDPRWEAALEPHVKAYSDGLRAEDPRKAQRAFDHVQQEVREALSRAYEATHRAIDILRGIDPAPSVAHRWATDLREWGDHARRSATGIPRFARRHDALRAARTLQRWSSAAEQLETAQAFDDPLIMAGLDAEGRCVTGDVVSVDTDNKEVKPGNQRASAVPLIALTLTGGTRLLEGEIVRWAADSKIRGRIRSLDDASATIAVLDGARSVPTSGPFTGEEVVFVGLDPWGGTDPWTPDEIPWTHRERTTSELAGAEGNAAAGANDDSPDLSLDELAEIPVIGAVGPADEPGVVL